MFEIRENTFYSRMDLAELLTPMGVDVDLFISRLKCRKVFRGLWCGADLIKAYATAPELGEHEHTGVMPRGSNKGNQKRRSQACAMNSGA